MEESLQKPIYGLVLAGGKSSRMGQDKAGICYHGGKTQLEYTVNLLRGVVDRVFVSQRADQVYPLPDGVESIADKRVSVKGPLCGILSAMESFPEADWLVLAVDLPLLDVEELKRLMDVYQSNEPRLTAFRSSYDGLPEPLCAIYPKASRRVLLRRAEAMGRSCPRKLLILEEATLVDLKNPRALDNINTPEDLREVSEVLS